MVTCLSAAGINLSQCWLIYNVILEVRKILLRKAFYKIHFKMTYFRSQWVNLFIIFLYTAVYNYKLRSVYSSRPQNTIPPNWMQVVSYSTISIMISSNNVTVTKVWGSIRFVVALMFCLHTMSNKVWVPLNLRFFTKHMQEAKQITCTQDLWCVVIEYT